MPKIKISEIKITRRQRRDLDMDEVVGLADSISRWGLLHPITLRKENNELIAGFRRTQAHMALGLDEIEYRYQEDLTDVETKELELEENIRRVNLTWQEEAQAIAEIHGLKKHVDPEWTVAKTAEFVGKSSGTVSNAVSVSKEAEADPTVWESNGIVAAKKKVDRKKKIEARKIQTPKAKEIGAEILLGDAADLIQTEPDEEYDAIITNFPFGVDLTFKDGSTPYEDDETYITDLVMDMVPELYRTLKQDSWLVAFFDIRKLTLNSFTRQVVRGYGEDLTVRRSAGLTWWLEDAGFSYVSMLPFIWVKPNKTQGLIGSPDRGMVIAYEAGVFAAKGDPTLNKSGRQNIFIYDTLTSSERDFSVEMPSDLCDELVQMTCFEGSKILDPFAGSGAIGSAALRRSCSFKGFEIDEGRAELGNLKLRETYNVING